VKIKKQYLSLHRHFGGEKEAWVHLSQLAEALNCTHRNAALLITKMNEMKWVVWTPTRGRGKRSSLRFLIDPDDMAREIVEMAVSQRDISAAIDEIRSHANSLGVQEQLERWLLSRFGPHTETVNQKRVDTLRLPVRGAVHTLDPLAMNLLTESFVASHIFDTLIRITDEAQVVPHLAHSWDSDDTRTIWTFHLRKGVTFHNGKELDSEDAVYSMERLMKVGQRTLFRTIFKHIQRVRVLDRYTFRIELDERNELFLPFLCTVRAAILPKGLGMMSEQNFGSKPIGTGPFSVHSLQEQLCVLEVFPSYFRERALLDRVEIWVVPPHMSTHREDDPELFSIIHNPPQTQEESDLWLQTESKVSVTKFITVNSKKAGPMSDPALRSLVMKGLTGNDLHTVWKESIPLTLMTIPPYHRDAQQAMLQLQASGIPIRIEPVTSEQFMGAARHQADLILFSLIRDQDEPLRLFDLYHHMAEHLEPHSATDITTQLRKIIKETDPQKRNDLFSSIEDRLVQKHLLHIVSERKTNTAVHRSLRGVRFNAQGWVDLRGLWFRG